MSKNVLFKSEQLYWINFKQDCTHIDHKQLDHLLLFKIMCTTVFVVAAALDNF